MTSPTAPIGEDDLQAYVDERLSEARRAAVEAYLAAHPALAARIAAERGQREALRARLAEKYGEPVPTRLRISSIRAGRRQRHLASLRSAAAVVALLVVGGAGGWFARQTLPPPASPATMLVTQDAVAAYRTFVVEVAHPVEVRAGDEAHLVQWLSRRLGRPLAAPDLTPYGFRLMGGRLLPAGDDAAAMLMYDDDRGHRLTVYVRAGATGETAFRFRQEGEVGTFAWLDEGYGFAVSATTDRDRLLPIAEAVYQALDRGRPGAPAES